MNARESALVMGESRERRNWDICNISNVTSKNWRENRFTAHVSAIFKPLREADLNQV